MTDLQYSQALKNIKVVSFDVDDTLWGFESAMTSALGLTLERIRLTVPTEAAMRLTVDDMKTIRDDVSEQMGGDAVGVEKIRHAAFVKTLETIGQPDREFAAELYHLYMEARFSDVSPFAEVPYRLDPTGIAIPTRRHLQRQYPHPTRLGLPNAFDFVVFAADCGVTKPNPRIFRLALSKIEHSSEQVLHVGDSLQNDVAGANNCGLISAWLNRKNTPNTTKITPDLEVRNLQHLAKILLP